MPKSPTSRPAPRSAGLSDPRSLRSRELLRAALLRLIEDRQFDRITLRDIAAEAGVSYPTFFNHYASKEDLFQEIAREEMGALLEAFRKDRDSSDWRPGEGMCAHIAAHRGLWRTLITAGATEAMRSEFIRRGADLAHDRPSLGHGFPFDVLSGVIASGTFEIIRWWLAQDEGYPIGGIADMLETLVIEPALGMPPGHFTGRKGIGRNA